MKLILLKAVEFAALPEDGRARHTLRLMLIVAVVSQFLHGICELSLLRVQVDLAESHDVSINLLDVLNPKLEPVLVCQELRRHPWERRLGAKLLRQYVPVHHLDVQLVLVSGSRRRLTLKLIIVRERSFPRSRQHLGRPVARCTTTLNFSHESFI